MPHRLLTAVISLLLLTPLSGWAQGVYQWANFAGSAGTAGFTDNTGSDARFSGPAGVTVDASGNFYVADYFNHTLRKITPGGIVTTLAGTPGFVGGADGTGPAAEFFCPSGLAINSDGNVVVADSLNNTIRIVTPAGVVTTLAGDAGEDGSSDGTGSDARFSFPASVAADGEGNVYVADSYNNTIRKITSAGVVTTLAGLPGPSGFGSSNGTGSAARFYFPSGVAVDASGFVYVADTGNHVIRKISPAGVVSTVAGSVGQSGSLDDEGIDARFNAPTSLAIVGNGSLYVADTGNHTIRKINPAGVVTTIGGTAGVTGNADGGGNAALFSSPQALTVFDGGTLMLADFGNDRLTQGTAPPPDISIDSPTRVTLIDGTGTVDMGNTGLNIDSLPKTLTVRNVGGYDLTGLSVMIDGANASEFTASILHTALVSGESTTLSVTAHATALGVRTATLHVLSNDPDEASFDIALTSVGAAPPALVSASIISNHSFPNLAKSGNTITLSFTVSEAILTPTVSIAGQTATVSNPAGNFWTASILVGAAPPQGPAAFTLTFLNLAGTPGEVDNTTTDGSSVNIDTEGPQLFLPANQTVELGTAVTFTPTAADPGPVTVTSSPPSGSTFPLGTTTVQVTATDLVGNSTLGTFQVTLVDTIPPNLTGLEDVTIWSLTKTGAVVNLTPNVVDADDNVTITTNPASGSLFPFGQTLVDVSATDSSGNQSTGTMLVTVASFVAGSYNGLVTPTGSSTAPADEVGCITLKILATGAFTGKLTLGGSASPIVLTGLFGSSGQASFGKSGSSSFSILRPGKTALGLSLTLDYAAAAQVGKVTGTLKKSGNVTNANVSADRAIFTAKANPVAPLSNVPTTILNPLTNKGKYTVILPADPGLAASSFPKGNGWALLSVSKAGVVSAKGKLGDGTAFSCSRPLSPSVQWPFYVPLYSGKGSISGPITFRDVPSVSDADGLDLRWFKPVNFADKTYPNGWPTGITTDLYASQYVTPPAGQSALLLSGATSPDTANLSILLTDGHLADSRSNNASVNDKSKVTTLGATPTFSGTEKLKCTINAKTGAITGSFTHPVSLKPTTFQGAILQKQHLGSGYFTGAPAPGTTSPLRSGSVSVQPLP